MLDTDRLRELARIINAWPGFPLTDMVSQIQIGPGQRGPDVSWPPALSVVLTFAREKLGDPGLHVAAIETDNGIEWRLERARGSFRDRPRLIRDAWQRYSTEAEAAVLGIDAAFKRSAFIEARVAELTERFEHFAEYPTFTAAVRIIVEALTDDLGLVDWPLEYFHTDGADVDHDGKPITSGWSFAVLSLDPTSYVTDHDGELALSWTGTTWVEGCECADDDRAPHGEHMPGCPALD